MTNKEKIIELKNTIYHLYCKEGRSKSYISRLLELDRKLLSIQINEWEFKQANISRLTPSNQKFVNKHKDFIIAEFKRMTSESEIARKLNITRDHLRYLIPKVPELQKTKDEYMTKYGNIKKDLVKDKQELYSFCDYEGEVWKPILGYEDYEISNFGRVKKYLKSYDCYQLLHTYPNKNNGRIYVSINKKFLQVARLVGHAFVEGFSDENNTINHKDKDVSNNHYLNLEWISQSENNKHAYATGRSKVAAYQRNGRFHEIIVDDKWHFKTIVAMAKFLNVSESEAHRYISGEIQFDKTIRFIY